MQAVKEMGFLLSGIRAIYVPVLVAFVCVNGPAFGYGSAPSLADERHLPGTYEADVRGLPAPRESATEAGHEEKAEILLWEGFEEGNNWSADSSGVEAELAYSLDRSTEGNRSLKIAARFGMGKKALVRKMTQLRLDGMTAVLADVYCTVAGVGFSFAFKDQDNVWHESASVPLQVGWNRNVAAKLSNGIFSNEDIDRLPVRMWSGGVREFYLVVHRAEVAEATVHVDNIRFAGNPEDGWTSAPPEGIEVFQPVRGIEQYEKFEIAVQFKGASGDFFDREQISVDGVFTGPDGERKIIPGFFAGYADHQRWGKSWPIWLVRFATGKVGRWQYEIRVENSVGENVSERRWFYVKASDRRGGFIRISDRDPHFFEREGGRFFYPIGQNVCWAQNYEPYFRRQARTGQNWVRIWMCPWNLQLEVKPADYDLEAAARLDTVVGQASAHGINIQLVLIYHGMLTDESWGKNPYNRENGGPCYYPAQFFTSSQAKRLFKQRLDYLAARWGCFENIVAWELFNEVSLCRYDSFDDVLEWHREMSDYLKEVDPYEHLITTSVHSGAELRQLWALPNIDFTQAHIYSSRIAERAWEEQQALRAFGKPFFVGEFGRDTSGLATPGDTRGLTLHSGLWNAFMLPAAGCAMPWWWDAKIKPHNLERFFAPLSEFAKDMDRRGRNYRRLDTAMLLEDGRRVSVRGLLSNSGCYLWFFREGYEPAQGAAERLIPRGQQVALSGMLGGKYQVSIYDTVTGEVLRRSALSSRDGRLVLPLVSAANSIAVKIHYEGSAAPRFFTSPELLELHTGRGLP